MTGAKSLSLLHFCLPVSSDLARRSIFSRYLSRTFLPSEQLLSIAVFWKGFNIGKTFVPNCNYLVDDDCKSRTLVFKPCFTAWLHEIRVNSICFPAHTWAKSNPKLYQNQKSLTEPRNSTGLHVRFTVSPESKENCQIKTQNFFFWTEIRCSYATTSTPFILFFLKILCPK